MKDTRRYVCVLLLLASMPAFGVSLTGLAHGQSTLASSPPSSFALQQWVRIEDGSLRGVLNRPWTSFDSVAQVHVRLISILDSTVRRSETSEDGRFEFSNLKGGPYVFVASGGGHYASFAVHLIESAKPGIAELLEVPLSQVSASVMREFARKHIPAKLVGKEPVRPLFSHGSIPANAAQAGQPAVRLTTGGSISGQLWIPAVGQTPRVPAAGMVVAICLGDRTIATTDCDEEGKFSLDGLIPGIYTFTAAGKDGFLAFGVELIEPGANTAVLEKVSARKTWSQNAEVRQTERKLCPSLECEVFPLWEVVGINDII